MKNLINNEGKKVTVSESLYNMLKNDYELGYHAIYIYDSDNKLQIIPLAENFQ